MVAQVFSLNRGRQDFWVQGLSDLQKKKKKNKVKKIQSCPEKLWLYSTYGSLTLTSTCCCCGSDSVQSTFLLGSWDAMKASRNCWADFRWVRTSHSRHLELCPWKQQLSKQSLPDTCRVAPSKPEPLPIKCLPAFLHRQPPVFRRWASAEKGLRCSGGHIGWSDLVMWWAQF